MKSKLYIEKYSPEATAIAITLFTYILHTNCNIEFLHKLSHSLLKSESLNAIITIEGIVFGATLTFLGLFMQMNNKTMNFIIEKSDKTFRNIIRYIILSIVSSLFMVVYTYLIYIFDINIHSTCAWCWVAGLLYSFLALVRVLYSYTILITPPKEKKDKKPKVQKKNIQCWDFTN